LKDLELNEYEQIIAGEIVLPDEINVRFEGIFLLFASLLLL
jgi:hypothetical protein